MEDQDKWGLALTWNAALLEKEERPLKLRNNLWASELGKSPIDIWLKMRATPVSNPPNARSLRKFEAGNVFEWIISLILKRAGILRDSQHWSSHRYDGLLEVTGKADFIAGGKPDLEKWEQEMGALELPDVFRRAGEKSIKFFQEKYPNGLDERPLEIKSVSSFMFDALERKQSSSLIHRIQAFHYLKSENRPKANLVYICRDDLRMMEFVIQNPGPVEEEYKNAIAKISQYHLANERPPLERPIVFDEDIGRFAKNFNVAYSSYLTLLYGFPNQREFDDMYSPIVSRWNRVLNRVKKGVTMTTKNQQVIEEMQMAEFNIDSILKSFVEDDAPNGEI